MVRRRVLQLSRTLVAVSVIILVAQLLFFPSPAPLTRSPSEAIIALAKSGETIRAARYTMLLEAHEANTLLNTLTPQLRNDLAAASIEILHALADLEEFGELERFIPLAGRLSQDSAASRALRGRIFDLSRRHEAAVRSYRAALDSDPSCFRTVRNLARLVADDPDELYALGLFLAEQKVEDGRSYLEVAARLEGTERLHQARAVYAAALALDNQDPLLASRHEAITLLTSFTPSERRLVTRGREDLENDEAAIKTSDEKSTGETEPLESRSADGSYDDTFLDHLLRHGWVGMPVDDLLALIGEPTTKQESRLPRTGLFALGPRPERWDYINTSGTRGVVVQIIDDRVSALSPYQRSPQRWKGEP